MTSRPSPYGSGNSRRAHTRGRQGRHDAGQRPSDEVFPAVRLPNRNVLMITDLRALQHLANPAHPDARRCRMLAPRYYSSCNPGELESLFTHSCLVVASQLHQRTMAECLASIADYLRDTFLLDIDHRTLELRMSDEDGDVFQVAPGTNLLEVLDSERRYWRRRQEGSFALRPIPEDTEYPFIARFSCHPFDPQVILH